jgi:hypothetical protein
MVYRTTTLFWCHVRRGWYTADQLKENHMSDKIAQRLIDYVKSLKASEAAPLYEKMNIQYQGTPANGAVSISLPHTDVITLEKGQLHWYCCILYMQANRIPFSDRVLLAEFPARKFKFTEYWKEVIAEQKMMADGAMTAKEVSKDLDSASIAWTENNSSTHRGTATPGVPTDGSTCHQCGKFIPYKRDAKGRVLPAACDHIVPEQPDLLKALWETPLEIDKSKVVTNVPQGVHKNALLGMLKKHGRYKAAEQHPADSNAKYVSRQALSSDLLRGESDAIMQSLEEARVLVKRIR